MVVVFRSMAAVGSRVPKGNRERKTIELAPAVYREIMDLVSAGQWLSFQEFAREAVKDYLERWKRDHPLGAPKRPT